MFLQCASVAQLDRALVYGTKGYRFESCQTRFNKKDHYVSVVFSIKELFYLAGLGPKGVWGKSFPTSSG